MNLKKLKQAEKDFFEQYPGGFSHPFFEDILKRHNIQKMTQKTKEAFCYENFEILSTNQMTDWMIKIINASSMVSLFEKPKFRELIKSLDNDEKVYLVNALKNILHHKNQKQMQKGFESFLQILDLGKIARWTLVTAIPCYFYPDKEVFIKPTTTKNIIKHLELDCEYKPSPTWDFYQKYRTIINQIKKEVDESLSPNNPAFCGFLMTSLNQTD